MSGFDNSAPIEMTCPECGHRWTIRFGDLRTGESLRCPECDLELDTSELKRGLDEAERETFGRGIS